LRQRANPTRGDPAGADWRGHDPKVDTGFRIRSCLIKWRAQCVAWCSPRARTRADVISRSRTGPHDVVIEMKASACAAVSASVCREGAAGTAWQNRSGDRRHDRAASCRIGTAVDLSEAASASASWCITIRLHQCNHCRRLAAAVPGSAVKVYGNNAHGVTPNICAYAIRWCAADDCRSRRALRSPVLGTAYSALRRSSSPATILLPFGRPGPRRHAVCQTMARG